MGIGHYILCFCSGSLEAASLAELGLFSSVLFMGGDGTLLARTTSVRLPALLRLGRKPVSQGLSLSSEGRTPMWLVITDTGKLLE